ncbi:hypothetical protein [Sphingomonas sanxanigenens]|uniref:hypothetical protein n=1 Tax=Sphingomonas sanxanigenens TaxID=397260 RepID=UPI0013014708|nr:hypothetical protein [Sphingomonas sanxanigenens]
MTEWAGLTIGLIAGAALAPATLNGDPGRLLSTFLGLISASILPTVSLIIASMSSGGRSVMAINSLQKELVSAIDALFFLLACVGIVFAALFSISIPTPALLTRIPYLSTEIFPRFGQSLVIGGSALIILRAWHVPAILRSALRIRHDIAVDEARKKTVENAAHSANTDKLFPRDSEFGKTINLSDLQ